MGLLDKQTMRILGIVLFVVGLVIWYAIRRRKFYRRTMTGAERFRSYEGAWFTRLAETILSAIAIFLMLGGASAFILSYDN